MASRPTIKSDDVQIRPATKKDIDRFYKGTFQVTCEAMVGIRKGRIICCGGLAYTDGNVIAFCDIKPIGRKYKMPLMLTAWNIIRNARKRGVRVMYAEADPKEAGAERWLKAMGFEPTQKPRIFRWKAMT